MGVVHQLAPSLGGAAPSKVETERGGGRISTLTLSEVGETSIDGADDALGRINAIVLSTALMQFSPHWLDNPDRAG